MGVVIERVVADRRPDDEQAPRSRELPEPVGDLVLAPHREASDGVHDELDVAVEAPGTRDLVEAEAQRLFGRRATVALGEVEEDTDAERRSVHQPKSVRVYTTT